MGFMEINFVQISDLHLHFNNYESEKMRKELLKYLSEMSKTTQFDFLVITGDITHKGSRFKQSIKDYLDEVLASINLTRKNVYIVPGNHDLNRDETRGLVIEGIKSNGASSDELDKSLGSTSTNKVLLKSFSNFFKFYKDFIGEDYPKKEIHFIKGSDKYNIVHINTCLVAYKSNEEGSLLVGKQKLLKCLDELDNTSNKINIAIGHHTLGCMFPVDKNAIQTNFEDYCIDMYLSGHVHQPGYHIEANGNTSILNVVSGAGLLDSYANGGFVTANITLDTGTINVRYHSWNRDSHYWTINNNVGRKASTGILSFPLDRIKKQDVTTSQNIVEEYDDELNEDEFKQFIIDFHQHPQKKGNTSKYETKKEEIEQKFENMRCSESFENLFLRYATYFSAIEEIMNTTSYIESEKKEILSEIIIETYFGIHNSYSTGDEIFINLVDIIFNNTIKMRLPYTENETRRYIRILIAWCIYDCGIFNEKKNTIKVV